MLSACGSGSNSKQDQADVRAAQTEILKNIQQGDLKAYCSATFSSNMYSQSKNIKTWVAQCNKTRGKSVKLSTKQKAVLKSQLASVAKTPVQFTDGQAVVALPGAAPSVFKKIDGKWLLNTDASVKINFAQQQKTTVRDLARFYLMTVINGDANGYCVVTTEKPADRKDCISKTKAWVKDKKSSWSKVKKQAQDQVKNIDKAEIDVQDKRAEVKVDPSVVLVNSKNGSTWIVQASQGNN